MIDFSKPVQAKKGNEAVIYTTDGKGEYPVVGQVKKEDDDWRSGCWTLSGENPTQDSDYNLINVPEKHVRYINFYSGGIGAHEDRKAADKVATASRIACIRIEFEDGQFDD